MKKIYLVGAMCAYLFAGCAGNASQAGHDEHNHELEAHDHDHEGHEHEGHDHEHEAGGTHPGEIVFKKALAEAVGGARGGVRDRRYRPRRDLVW